jgi:hypothetical protein
MAPPFVVVSGLPGSGKSTLARQLAPALGLSLIDKDDILERLFESKGIADAAWRRRLSRESDGLLQAEASASAGAVLASFWQVPGMPADSGTPIHWLFELSELIVNVRCLCPAAVAARRFMDRRRHEGHLDGQRTYADVLGSIEALARFGSLDVGDAIEVDTSRETMPGAIAREIRDAFTRWHTAACSRRRPP